MYVSCGDRCAHTARSNTYSSLVPARNCSDCSAARFAPHRGGENRSGTNGDRAQDDDTPDAGKGSKGRGDGSVAGVDGSYVDDDARAVQECDAIPRLCCSTPTDTV